MENNNLNFKDILNKHILNALNELEENNIEYSITQFKSIVSSTINQKIKGITEDLSYEVKSNFSGRGRAWAKIEVNEECPVWNQIKRKLSVGIDDPNFEKLTTLLDLFENSGFGWARYSGSNSKYSNFKLRYNGAKNVEGLTLKIPNDKASKIPNLEGVPHHIGLEDNLGADNVDDVIQKVPNAEDPVPSENELASNGIMTLESILNGHQ